MILITGIAGFIGSHLAERLVAQKESLVGIDNFNDYYPPALKEYNVRQIQKKARARKVILYREDIRHRPRLESIFKKHRPETVIHLAAQAGVRYSLQNPVYYEETNNLGTLHLLDLARQYKVAKFIFASSSSVYGNTSRIPFQESDRFLEPVSFYGLTKLTGEKYCQYYNQTFGLPVVLLRFFTVYGPRQRPDMAFFKFIRNLDEGREIELYGYGSLERDFTYIGDIVEGILPLLNPTFNYGYFTSGEIFNLGHSQPVVIREVVALMEKILKKKAKLNPKETPPGDVLRTYAQIDKARHILGFQPKTTLEEGLRQFIRWYLKEGKKILKRT